MLCASPLQVESIRLLTPSSPSTIIFNPEELQKNDTTYLAGERNGGQTHEGLEKCIHSNYNGNRLTGERCTFVKN